MLSGVARGTCFKVSQGQTAPVVTFGVPRGPFKPHERWSDSPSTPTKPPAAPCTGWPGTCSPATGLGVSMPFCAGAGSPRVWTAVISRARTHSWWADVCFWLVFRSCSIFSHHLLRALRPLAERRSSWGRTRWPGDHPPVTPTTCRGRPSPKPSASIPGAHTDLGLCRQKQGSGGREPPGQRQQAAAPLAVQGAGTGG